MYLIDEDLQLAAVLLRPTSIGDTYRELPQCHNDGDPINLYMGSLILYVNRTRW